MCMYYYWCIRSSVCVCVCVFQPFEYNMYVEKNENGIFMLMDVNTLEWRSYNCKAWSRLEYLVYRVFQCWCKIPKNNLSTYVTWGTAKSPCMQYIFVPIRMRSFVLYSRLHHILTLDYFIFHCSTQANISTRQAFDIPSSPTVDCLRSGDKWRWCWWDKNIFIIFWRM